MLGLRAGFYLGVLEPRGLFDQRRGPALIERQVFRMFIRGVLVVLFVVALLAACTALFVLWRACEDSGGVMVRGRFGMECLARR